MDNKKDKEVVHSSTDTEIKIKTSYRGCSCFFSCMRKTDKDVLDNQLQEISFKKIELK